MSRPFRHLAFDLIGCPLVVGARYRDVVMELGIV